MENCFLHSYLSLLSMDLDPTVRTTFWGIVTGNFFVWTCFASIYQGTVQRFLAVPTYKDSQK